ncbi:MAG: ORF6C domain-containing protein [Nitrososphaera sp.]|nr:ORF6C domain-containing protein [Nitrososphaera sp.]
MTQELVPIEQRDVEWEDETLVAVLVDEGEGQEIYIPVQPICDYLGLSWRGQRARIQRDSVLSETARLIKIVRQRKGKQGGTVTQSMLSLPLKYVNGWLFGVDDSRVREDLQVNVVEFKRRCYDILSAAFEDRVMLPSKDLQVLPSNVTQLAQIRDISLAVANMAHQMILQAEQLEAQESRLTGVEGATTLIKSRLDAAAYYVKDIEKRLQVVETRTEPRNIISEDQADIVKAKVLALADMMAEHDPDPTKKQYYQGVYRTLYIHFDVGSYKRISNKDYEAVLQFLEGWRNRILADD